MVRNDFVETKRNVVIRVMTAWLRGIEFVKNKDNRAETLRYMDTFYKEHNVSLSLQSMEEDLKLITLYSLDEQIALMDRSKGNPPSSEYDSWTVDVSEFMLQNGVVDSYEHPTNYITDEFFLAIRDDPEAAAYARFEEYVPDSSARRGCSWSSQNLFFVYLVWLLLK